MRDWRTRLSELLRQWRVARMQEAQIRRDREDEHAATELQRARDGYTRFPPSGM
jgi:hypothetical protein